MNKLATIDVVGQHFNFLNHSIADRHGRGRDCQMIKYVSLVAHLIWPFVTLAF
jgi:hypothetical protein